MNIIPLPTAVPNEDAIAMLEDWLQLVRSGEHVSIAIAGKTAAGDYDTSYFGSAHELAGPTAYLLYRINKAIEE